MAKTMTLRYGAKCRVCQKEIPAGARAIWFGKRAGVSHVECQTTATKTNGKLPSETVLKYADLRQDFINGCSGQNGSSILQNPANVTYWNSMSSQRNKEGNWTGATNAETLNWLQNGYMVPGLDGVDSTLIPGAPKRKLRFAEEGDEMLIDLAWSGVDEHFITWDKRMTKPSLQVKISVSFSSIIPFRIVNSYQSWVARMLQTIDSFGLDMQVDLIAPGTHQLNNDPGKHTAVIRVKESGEANDFSNWSPMFSPAGYRHLTFLAIVKSADVLNIPVAMGLGKVIDANEWTVVYDKETNVLTVKNNNDMSDFPEFAMTQKLIAILSGITG